MCVTQLTCKNKNGNTIESIKSSPSSTTMSGYIYSWKMVINVGMTLAKESNIIILHWKCPRELNSVVKDNV